MKIRGIPSCPDPWHGTPQPSTQLLTLAQCPAITTRAWEGRAFRCELPVAHDGLHITNMAMTPMAVEWDYDDRERSDD